MKGKLLASTICFLIASALVCTTVFAQATNPNGFPSGPHFNLNIHGKRADFTCPAPEYYLRVTADNNGDLDGGTLVTVCDEGDACEVTSTQIYGNSIFVPETTSADKVKVYVESGKKGPKNAPSTTELEVTDWCGGFGGDNEVRFRLPANEKGYNVYARILAKPTDNPSMSFSDPQLAYAEAEDGSLVWVGTLTSDGVLTPTEFTFTRTKGKSTAQDITALFQWTGDVCYTEAAEGRTATDFCMTDTTPATYYPDDGTGCGDDLSISLFCSSHTDEWVFNIADFVGMFYDVTNNGSKLVQVRFYPRN